MAIPNFHAITPEDLRRIAARFDADAAGHLLTACTLMAGLEQVLWAFFEPR